jgi:PAS domain-containing protein
MPELTAVRNWRLLAIAAAIGGTAFALWPAQPSVATIAFAVAVAFAAGAALIAVLLTAELKQHNKRIRNALDNIAQGLCMFDGSERLVVSNKTYLDMYGLSAKRVRPGMSLRKLLEYRKATGNFARDIEE